MSLAASFNIDITSDWSERMILTSNHLAVIRAALNYWNDEMSPHPPAVYTAYFEEAIGDGAWIGDAVTELRERLPTCRLRYARCSKEASTLLSNQLFETPEAGQHSVLQDAGLIATVLLDDSSPG